MQHERFWKVVGLLPLTAALAACAPREAPAPAVPAVDTAAVTAGVADLWARWVTSDTAENLDAIADLMTEDGRLDIKGAPPMLGRAAVKATMAPLYGQVNYLEASNTPSRTVAISNDLAHQMGTYRERYTTKGQKGERTDYGRYASALTKGADGQWRWAYMIAMVDSTVTKE